MSTKNKKNYEDKLNNETILKQTLDNSMVKTVKQTN